LDALDEYRTWCGRELVLRYGDAEGEVFQDLFADLMERAENTFVRNAPWGDVGDLSCDGYLGAERRLFACYAPRKLGVGKTNAKLTADFAGAREHWHEHMDVFTLVYNDVELPAPVTENAVKLQDTHGVPIETWSLNRLAAFVERLDEPHLRALFGDPPSAIPLHGIGSAQVRQVLSQITAHLSLTTPVGAVDMSQPPPEKLTSNGFSVGVQEEIRSCLFRTDLVREVLGTLPLPGEETRVAAWIKQQYSDLRSEGRLTPDDIYETICTRVAGHGGGMSGTPRRAAQVVVAYFFEVCEIFEGTASSAASN